MPSPRSLAAPAGVAPAPATGARGPGQSRPVSAVAEPAEPASKPPLEHSILLTATLCLFAVGAVMVYSASSAEALLDGRGDPSTYLKRYVLYGALGLLAMRICSRMSLKAVKRLTPILLILSFALTAAVMIPGVGVNVNGATRWLGVGPIQFQPSELLKVALVLYAAALLAARPRRVRTMGGLVKPLALVVGAACALLMAQPDMGTALVVCAAIGVLLVAAGARIRHLAVLAGGLAVLALVLALAEPYRRERLTAFIDPWADAGDTGFQAVQAMIAIGSGGLFGVGLGESVQKVFYLPEAHTDMIVAIIGEELGLVGAVSVVGLFLTFAILGVRTALAAPDRFGMLVAGGVTAWVLTQALVNIGGVLGLLPITGLTLPFISFGGSSLVVTMAATGILLNIARQPAKP